MKYTITLLFQFVLFCAYAQNNFTPSQVDEVLLKIPEPLNQDKTNNDLIRAIEAVDKNYRQIADTLYDFRSSPHTIFQNILIETNDSAFINPISFGGRLQLTSIVFYNPGLNTRVDSLAKTLQKTQRTALYDYLKANYDNFSVKTSKLNAQPVRIRYIKFPDQRFVQVGIDIYGAHFRWSIDRNQDWKIIQVERLWVY